MHIERTPFIFFLFIILSVLDCSRTQSGQTGFSMNEIAEAYVKLALGVGQHDADYVDAYYGPPEWKLEAEKNKKTLADIRRSTENLWARLEYLSTAARFDEMGYLRYLNLSKQLLSLQARVELLEGMRYTFDQESKMLYDAVAPAYPDSHFREILAELDHLLPGEESSITLQQRYERFRSGFVIPKEKLGAVFTAAIEECRRRTKQYIDLPPDESFVVEYVTGKPWSGYNWYKGNGHSVIQVNTDLPIYIDRAIDLAAHEGYPGHHVYNALLEKNLVKERGWIEFSVYPLFSPQSLIAEGSANYGVEVVFTREERMAYERDVLFPLAGLDPSRVEMYYTVHDLTAKLSYADNEAARRYLNGEIDRKGAVRWLMEYKLLSADRAEQRVRFIEKYRAYVINYNLGQDLVKKYIESRGGVTSDRKLLWQEFALLLSSPQVPSGLKPDTAGKQ